MNALIKTEKLSVGYPPAHVLFQNLDLALIPGELVCFMGPNGIGKSTLIRTLAGLQSALSGSISERDEKLIGLVLTDRIAASHMTVDELITFGRYPYLDWSISLSADDEEIIRKAVATVEIQSLLNKKLYELSDGQLQLSLICRALVQQTPVMLLDEPTAHLDLNNRVRIMNLLRSLARKENKAILVATHELDLALQTADNIWLAMPDKSIKIGIPEDLVLDGSLDEVFQLKGFDLKTGKVEHELYRKIKIELIGDGPVFLWTKNALERNGFVVADQGDKIVRIEQNQWRVDNEVFVTLSALLDKICKRSKLD